MTDRAASLSPLKQAFQAIDLAEKGIKQLPKSAAIRIQLAEVYREKLKDNCATSRVYLSLIHI